MARDLRNMVVLAGSTVGSRVLGLVRDMLAFGLLGLSGLHSAYAVAFTIPNLFRRLLGEGALSSALVPVYSEEMHREEGEEYSFLNQVVSWVGLVLVGLVGVGMLLMWWGSGLGGLEGRWYMGLKLGIWLLPYMVFVCLAGMLGAVLNVKGRFGLVGMSQIWLNAILIGAMVLAGYVWGGGDWEIVMGLCVGVMLGGLVQLLVPWVLLWRLGWKFRLDFGVGGGVQTLWRLLLPGLLGAGVLQLNQVVVKLLAFGVNDAGASVLYLASRLVELPLGVFTIAVVTVVFPKISKLAVAGGDIGEEYGRGLRLIMAISVPAMVGLVVLREPILRVLFEWGVFTGEDVGIVGPILGVYALGIPFYSLATFASRGFHATKDMKTPYRVAVWVVLVNVGLSCLLMWKMGLMGLALSSVLVALVHGGVLQYLLVRKGRGFEGHSFMEGMGKVCAGAIIMGVVVQGILLWAEGQFGVGKLGSVVAVGLGVPLGIGVYYGFLRVFGHGELKEEYCK